MVLRYGKCREQGHVRDEQRGGRDASPLVAQPAFGALLSASFVASFFAPVSPAFLAELLKTLLIHRPPRPHLLHVGRHSFG